MRLSDRAWIGGSLMAAAGWPLAPLVGVGMFWFAVWLDRYLEGPCRQCGTDLPDAPRGGQP